MPFKPNYNLQRLERTRAKEAKKEEKLRARRKQAEEKAAGEPQNEEPGPPGAATEE